MKRTNASNLDKSMGFLALTPPVAWQAFPFGFGEKKDRGTGFSVLAARKIEQEP